MKPCPPLKWEFRPAGEYGASTDYWQGVSEDYAGSCFSNGEHYDAMFVKPDAETGRWTVRHYGQYGGKYDAYAETPEEGMAVADVVHEEKWNAQHRHESVAGSVATLFT